MKVYTSLLTIPACILFACQPSAQSDNSFPQGEWIDMSYSFDEKTIYWPTDVNGFVLDTVSEGISEGGYYYSAFAFCTAEHGGTHMDAPVHFAEGKHSVEQIPIDQLTGDGIVIDVSKKALSDRDYQVSSEDFTAWEARHGEIPEDALVFLRTGYGEFWPDREKYLGTSEIGPEAIPLLHFPGLAPEAATWIVENRKIGAIGLDTPSIDYGQSTDFQSHQILFAANIPAFENVANLDQLPENGFWVAALPVKIAGGSGGPVRIIGLRQKN